MDSDETPILREQHSDRVVVLRLNRPDRLNAVSLSLYQSLQRELDAIEVAPAVRAVVLTGAGRAFCVGADLKAHGSGELTPAQRKDYVDTGQRVYARLHDFPKPIVAAVNGHAIGAGLEMALSCDFIVASPEAKLRLPEIGLGTFVGGGVSYTLPFRIGLARTMELVMLGEFFKADSPIAAGMFNRVVDSTDVLTVSLNIADQLAAQAPLSLALAKRVFRQAQRMSYQEALDAEAGALVQCMGTKDWREGIAAFSERRAPEFTGE